MAQAERLTVFKVPLEDRPGTLLEVLQGLRLSKVNLAGMWGFSMGQDKAQVYLSARDPEKLEAALKAIGLAPEKGEVFYVKGGNRSGALIKTIGAISGAGINIEATDAIAVGAQYGSFIWVRPDDVARAEAALKSK